MRPFSSRMQKNVGTLYRRGATSARVSADSWLPAATFACSFQPLGDTGRRQDRHDEHMRMGERDSWRVFAREGDLDAEALDALTMASVGDRIDIGGRPYSLRGRPLPQAHSPDGAVLLWSFDVDGIA